MQYTETVHRMSRYDLWASLASFQSRKNRVGQIVFSPRGVPGGYLAPR